MTPRERVLKVLHGGHAGKMPFTIYEYELPQCAVERELRAAVARLPNVKIALGTDVVGLTQDAERAHLQCADGRSISARWVIALDRRSDSRAPGDGAMIALGFKFPIRLTRAEETL